MAKNIAHFVHPAVQGIFDVPIRLMTSGMSPFLSKCLAGGGGEGDRLCQTPKRDE